MEDNFLQQILKTGLFDIGDSDERLKWLQASIADLQKKFEGDYSLLPKHTLVALNPNISDTEPVMIETETIVTTHWKALRGKYPEMPRNILRGVILNALYNVGKGNAIAARIINMTALNFYPYAKLNKEKSLVDAMLFELSELAEKNAIDEWSFIEEEPSLKLTALKISDFKFGAVSIDPNNLQPSLRTAINNNPVNNHGSQNGGNTTWGDHFATTAANGIATAFNTALAQLNQSINPSSIETPINKFFTEFKKTLDANLKTSFSSMTAVERRSKLLWWKETVYSPSLKRSYRGLNENLLPIVMGVDLNSQIPEITPISVDYLLRDTIFLLIEKKNESIKFSDYLKAISVESSKSILKTFFTNLNEEKGTISITDFIALLLNDRLSINDFKSKTGIDDNETMTLSELSVAVLHDLLIQRLITE